VWQALRPRDFPNYAAGTWGPKDADDLLARNEREWRPQPATDQAASVVKLDLAAREGFIMRQSVVFLFDVDNTLLDNDRVAADLKHHLEKEVGHERQQRYSAVFEELRSGLGYADYLGALQRYRTEYPRDPHLLTVSDFLVKYPFANRLFPNSLDALDHVKQFGRPVTLSDSLGELIDYDFRDLLTPTDAADGRAALT
jgi:hypothetical protein